MANLILSLVYFLFNSVTHIKKLWWFYRLYVCRMLKWIDVAYKFESLYIFEGLLRFVLIRDRCNNFLSSSVYMAVFPQLTSPLGICSNLQKIRQVCTKNDQSLCKAPLPNSTIRHYMLSRQIVHTNKIPNFKRTRRKPESHSDIEQSLEKEYFNLERQTFWNSCQRLIVPQVDFS